MRFLRWKWFLRKKNAEPLFAAAANYWLDRYAVKRLQKISYHKII